LTSTTRLALTAGAVALALALAGCGAADPGPEGSSPTGVEHDAADTEFTQMMIEHHQGALEMADAVVDRASTQQVRELGERISAAQAPEIELMTAWLAAWDEPLAADADMAGMDHGGMDMNGLDQQSAMDALAAVTGTEVDREFLELMIAHHEGAIDMAQRQTAEGRHPGALALARDIITAQEAEIAEMERLLAELQG